ncbi:MAG: peptidoglycan DD-metalloendopeptidase family protein [Coriobacteriia bacterium]|nr:peptidoglycan DD-metalloendopeptidase family protein [Coriobacteriia bacterium]
MSQSRLLKSLVSIAVVACLVMPASAFAYTRTDVDKHRAAAEAARKKAAAEAVKAEALLAETRKLETKIDGFESEIAKLGSEIGTAAQRRARLEKEISLLRASIADKEEKITGIQREYGDRVAALSARADAVYRAGDWVYLEMLLGSQDLSDFIQRTEFVTLLIRSDEEMANGLEADRSALEAANEELSRTLETVGAKRAEIKAEETSLRHLRSSEDNKRAEQQSVQDLKARMLAETKKNVARLRAAAQAEEQESQRIAQLLKGGSSHGGGKYAGSMTWPTPGYNRVSSSFGYRIHPILHYRKMHNGIDISAPSGARIVATGDGNVIFAGVRGGYGNCTMIDHGDGVVTVYAHQKRIAVRTGQSVSAGQTIGYVGSTGLSTGPHLHFEVRVNGDPVNPMNYL